MRTVGVWVAILVLTSTFPAGGHEAAQPFELTDPKGDVRPWSNLLPDTALPQAGTPFTDDADITALRITAETDDVLQVEIDVAGLDNQRDRLDPGGQPQIRVSFSTETGSIHYNLSINNLYVAMELVHEAAGFAIAQPHAEARLNACPSEPNERGQRRCQSAEFPISIDFENNRLIFPMPKSALLGLDPADPYYALSTTWTGPVILPAGSGLTGWTIETGAATTNPFAALKFVDWAPDEGPSDLVYRLESPAAGAAAIRPTYEFTRLSDLSGPTADHRHHTPHERVAVLEPEGIVALPFDLVNRGDQVRTYALNVSATGPADTMEVRVPAFLKVPAGEMRRFEAHIGLDTMDLGTMAGFQVTAHALGHPDEWSHFDFQGIVARMPDAENSRFYFHAAPQVAPWCEDRPGGCRGITAWANAAPDDPRRDGESHIPFGPDGTFAAILGNGEASWSRYQPAEVPFAHSVGPDPSRPWATELAIQAGSDRAVQVRLEFWADPPECAEACGSRTLLATKQIETNLRAGSNVVAIEGPVDPTAEAISLRGWHPDWRIQVTPIEAHAAETVAEDISLDPTATWFDFPLMPTGEPEALKPLPARLRLLEDADVFLNPGKTNAMSFRVTNEGLTPNRIHVETEPSVEGWEARVVPGNEYILEPGASVTPTLLVKAPAQAKEADKARVVLAAWPVEDAGLRSTANLSYLVVESFEYADEAEDYNISADAQEALFVPLAEDTPGPAFLGGLIAVAAAIAIRRRR